MNEETRNQLDCLIARKKYDSYESDDSENHERELYEYCEEDEFKYLGN